MEWLWKGGGGILNHFTWENGTEGRGEIKMICFVTGEAQMKTFCLGITGHRSSGFSLPHK